jgi:hypothetical protein
MVALALLASNVAGCGGMSQTASPPTAAGAGLQQTAANLSSVRPDAIVLQVRPQFLYLSEFGDQEDIFVTYNGSGVLRAVSSRPRGMPVRKARDVPRPKRFIVTEECYCAATITVKDNLGNSASMQVQGT